MLAQDLQTERLAMVEVPQRIGAPAANAASDPIGAISCRLTACDAAHRSPRVCSPKFPTHGIGDLTAEVGRLVAVESFEVVEHISLTPSSPLRK